MDNMSHIFLSLVGSKYGQTIVKHSFAEEIDLFHKICGP